MDTTNQSTRSAGDGDGADPWLVPGAEAVILQPLDRMSLRAESVTVERVLKRDVVLSNGDRFRVDTLSKRVGGTWGSTVHLVPPTDPRVAKTRHTLLGTHLRSSAIGAFEDWRRGKATAAEVVKAFAELDAYDSGAAEDTSLQGGKP